MAGHVCPRVESGKQSGRRPCHEQVADDLRAAMAAGSFEPGSRLPSQRQLAEQFAVSRATIVSAFDLLRGEGLIEVRRSAGSWVRRRT